MDGGCVGVADARVGEVVRLQVDGLVSGGGGVDGAVRFDRVDDGEGAVEDAEVAVVAAAEDVVADPIAGFADGVLGPVQATAVGEVLAGERVELGDMVR